MIWFGSFLLGCYSLCWCIFRDYGFVTGVVFCLMLWFLGVFSDLLVCFVGGISVGVVSY